MNAPAPTPPDPRPAHLPTLDLDALESLAKAATPGPIKFDGIYLWGPKMEMVADEHDGAVRARGVGAQLPIEANIAYIVAAYNSVPALVTYARSLEAELKRLRAVAYNRVDTCATHFRPAPQAKGAADK